MNTKIYYIEQDSSKIDKLSINKLEVRIDNYGKDYYPTINNSINTTNTTNNLGYNSINNYKITVTPKNGEGNDMSGGVLKYKKSTNKNWNVASNLEFVINELTQYDIIYEDQYKKSVKITVEVWINSSNGQIMIREI